ncbi:PspC domain-containing protein [Permianibacter sp. IMCC34836]|uniref:PspC domain-containing protein n=1 Tax=Permianibacter fluminis TaxID=2738515 RepID=UPI00155597F8|nr:PspC domain-containing protein [Permianibacter fluminis]NQD36661.1 PspC domain-containing protein [Permianibacter fluminis]
MSECPYCGRKNADERYSGRGPFRAAHGGKVFGVCAGIADHFGWSRFSVRLVTILALVFFFPATLIAYFLAALLLDREHEPHYDV